jgi:hypothetical protein
MGLFGNKDKKDKKKRRGILVLRYVATGVVVGGAIAGIILAFMGKKKTDPSLTQTSIIIRGTTNLSGTSGCRGDAHYNAIDNNGNSLTDCT